MMTTALEAYQEAKAAFQKRGHYASERNSFYDLKATRTEFYLHFAFGHKLEKCGACNGSGHYDHNGSPKCAACEGTGKDRYKGEKAWSLPYAPNIRGVDPKPVGGGQQNSQGCEQ
jgi:hypothetical protein